MPFEKTTVKSGTFSPAGMTVWAVRVQCWEPRQQASAGGSTASQAQLRLLERVSKELDEEAGNLD